MGGGKQVLTGETGEEVDQCKCSETLKTSKIIHCCMNNLTRGYLFSWR